MQHIFDLYGGYVLENYLKKGGMREINTIREKWD